MAGIKANLAENRAIHASEERGVGVTPFGTMRPLKPVALRAPGAGSASGHAPHMRVPRAAGMAKPPRIPGRKYYGE